jgi:hypothetical protein
LRLARIAKALVSGASVTEIAEAEGIGRTLASREANSPECRQLLAEFVSNEHDEMRALFYRSLRIIEHALSARREYMTKEGQIIYGGPDHYARLAATKHLRDFLSAGRPAPKQPEKEEKGRSRCRNSRHYCGSRKHNETTIRLRQALIECRYDLRGICNGPLSAYRVENETRRILERRRTDHFGARAAKRGDHARDHRIARGNRSRNDTRKFLISEFAPFHYEEEGRNQSGGKKKNR